MRRWSDSGKKHLIGPVEMYAVCLARDVWKSYLSNRAIFFVDQGGVLASLISGASKDSLWRLLLLSMKRIDVEIPSLSWFCRVASPSNLADGPLRGKWHLLQKLSYIRDSPRCLITGRDWKSCLGSMVFQATCTNSMLHLP